MPTPVKYLITGFSGFVSAHFLDLLESKGRKTEILGLDVAEPAGLPKYKHLKITFRKANLLDQEAVRMLLRKFRPDRVLHLASFSSVAFSWKEPVESFRNNTNIFLNLIEAIRQEEIRCRVISVGSSEEYGNVRRADLPLKESMTLKPVSPYAVARVSQEMLSAIYAKSFGIDIIMTRSFNHIGTGQKEIFVVPSFARQLLRIRESGEVLRTGDTSIIRDFVDVRDVCRAYDLLFQKGKKGEIYNICSGKGTSLNEVIDVMSAILGIRVKKRKDQDLVRPNDNRIIIGSNSELKKDTGWKPLHSLEKSLSDILRSLH